MLPLGTAIASGHNNPYNITSIPREMTYQGILMDSGGDPVTDSVYSVTFRIFNVASGGSSLWTQTLPCTTSSGYFDATLSNVNLPFDEDYWLELEIDSEILDPRQKLSMVGYAAIADTTDFALRVATVDGATGGTISGNINVTGKATIGPGHTDNSTYGTISGGIDNRVECWASTVGGGAQNFASFNYSTVAGGIYNEAIHERATVGGGQNNTANGDYSTIAGGLDNQANGHSATVAGGYSNTASADRSTVSGGQSNRAEADYTVIGGGRYNMVQGEFSTIAGGFADTITSTASYSYLFGIGSRLTQDSTFMVDLPHIRFGTEADGYEFPAADEDQG